MENNKYDALKLENQLCFPLYAASREIIKRYKPHLDGIGLTYTQYIIMMTLWDKTTLTAKELGKLLYLDSGTLTPVLRTMEEKGLLERKRSNTDERNLVVTITDSGRQLREKAVEIPIKMAGCTGLSVEEASALYSALYKILGK